MNLANSSARLDAVLREFAGGYVNTDEGVKKSRGAGAHFDRNTGKYVGSALMLGPGTLVGHFIDKNRKKHNVEDTKREGKAPWKSKGQVVAKDLESRMDAQLRNFQAISTAEQPYNYSGCGMTDSGSKPNFPSLYLSRSTDKGLMKLQGQGQAVVQYRIKSRTVDESTDDGVPLYGASIEIQSLEPIAGSEEGENDLSETLYLREFAAPVRSVTKLMKTSKLNPYAIRKTSVAGEFRVAPKGAAKSGPLGYYTDDIKDARNTAAAIWKKEHAQSKARGAAALRKKVDRMETGSGNRPDLTENAMPDWASEKVSRRYFSDHEFARGAQMAKFFPQHEKSILRWAGLPKGGRMPGDLPDLTHAAKALRKQGRKSGMMQISDFPEGMPVRREFAVARDRDGEGRYSAGNVPGANDYAIAGAVAPKKKMGLGKKIAIGAGIAGLGAVAGLEGLHRIESARYRRSPFN